MTDLANEQCEACQADAVKLTSTEIDTLIQGLHDWQVVVESDVPRLKRRYKLKNYLPAQQFVMAVGEIAEQVGHHPVIHFSWGWASVYWWSHEIKGLHRNDFIMAARTDQIFDAQ